MTLDVRQDRADRRGVSSRAVLLVLGVALVSATAIVIVHHRDTVAQGTRMMAANKAALDAFPIYPGAKLVSDYSWRLEENETGSFEGYAERRVYSLPANVGEKASDFYFSRLHGQIPRTRWICSLSLAPHGSGQSHLLLEGCHSRLIVSAWFHA
jgi:hypothetical protein